MLSPISLEKETIQNLILAFLCYCVIIIPNSLANILRTFVNSCISSRIPFSEVLSLVFFNSSCFSKIRFSVTLNLNMKTDSIAACFSLFDSVLV